MSSRLTPIDNIYTRRILSTFILEWAFHCQKPSLPTSLQAEGFQFSFDIETQNELFNLPYQIYLC